MRLNTLEQIKQYCSITKFRRNTIKNGEVKTVYLCKPVYFHDSWVQTEIWEGFIIYFTNASSHKIGTYKFVVNENSSLYKTKRKANEDNGVHFKLLNPFRIDGRLYYVQSEENIKKYPDKYLPETDYLNSQSYKALFTDYNEAKEYIEKITKVH